MIEPIRIFIGLDHRHVRPSFGRQVERREVSSSRVSAALHAADAAFLEHGSKHPFNNLDGDHRPT